MLEQKIYHDHYIFSACSGLGFYPDESDNFPIVSVMPYEEAGKDKYKILEIGDLHVEKSTTIFVIAKVNYVYYRRYFLEDEVKSYIDVPAYLVLCDERLVLIDNCRLFREPE